MNEPIRIRATLGSTPAGPETTVRVLMPHPMDSGNRKDAAGVLIPAYHITDVAVSHNGRPVLSAQFGPAVARDPLLTFRFGGGQAGDSIAVSWTDNRGESRSAQALIV